MNKVKSLVMFGNVLPIYRNNYTLFVGSLGMDFMILYITSKLITRKAKTMHLRINI